MIKEKFKVYRVNCLYDSSLDFTAAVFENDEWCQIQNDTKDKPAWWKDSPLAEKVVSVERKQFFNNIVGIPCCLDDDLDSHDWEFNGWTNFDPATRNYSAGYTCKTCGESHVFGREE